MITLEKVYKSFSGQSVLKDISVEIQPQESFVVLGKSGVGKSVLLKVIGKLLAPDSGVVSLKTSNVGMLFQKNALFDSMTVNENLDFPLREKTKLKKNDRKQKIAKFLEYVELSHAGEKFPNELSGGMQKRVGIARALIIEPEIMLYDEPTAGLDPITSRMITELIVRMQKEVHATLVSVTSDVPRAFELANTKGRMSVLTPEGLVILGKKDIARQEATKHPHINELFDIDFSVHLETKNGDPSHVH
ncbi:MAG: ABC transporter ATP-binding protein [Bacteriovoracia bacterium]